MDTNQERSYTEQQLDRLSKAAELQTEVNKALSDSLNLAHSEIIRLKEDLIEIAKTIAEATKH